MLLAEGGEFQNCLSKVGRRSDDDVAGTLPYCPEVLQAMLKSVARSLSATVAFLVTAEQKALSCFSVKKLHEFLVTAILLVVPIEGTLAGRTRSIRPQKRSQRTDDVSDDGYDRPACM